MTVADHVVLEALELDAPLARPVGDGEPGIIGEPAVGAHRAELAGLGDDLLLRPVVTEGLQHRGIDVLGTDERDGSAFGSGHGFRAGSEGRNLLGDWGLGVGDWGTSPTPNPQPPIPYLNLTMPSSSQACSPLSTLWASR